MVTVSLNLMVLLLGVSMDYLGELAALGTAVLGASNSILLTLAGRLVGSEAVNFARLFLALGVMIFLHYALFGNFFPVQAGWFSLLALGVSGLIGLALADALLFEAMLILGPRVALVMMTLSPIFSVILAWVLLGQSLSGFKIVAILVAMIGIALVVSESVDSTGPPTAHFPAWATGIILGVGSALGDSVGMILSHQGMSEGMNAISANLVRVAAGTIAIVFWLILRVNFLTKLQRLKDPKALLLIGGVAATGPLLGVILTLYSITRAPLGIAVTLMSLAPIFLLLASVLFFKEKVSLKAISGTLISIIGASALCFS